MQGHKWWILEQRPVLQCISGPLAESGSLSLLEEVRHNLTEIVEKNIPSKVLHKCNNTPWISQRIIQLHRRKQRTYNSAKKKNMQEAWDSWELRRKIKKETRKAYRNYIRDTCWVSKTVLELCKIIKKGFHLPDTSWQRTAQCAVSSHSHTFCMAVFSFLNNREIYLCIFQECPLLFIFMNAIY